jgi:histidine triad (HIT) family protein
MPAHVQQGEDCPFCQIAAGRESGIDLIAEDREWVAFFPDSPAALGHLLIVPREHVVDFWQLDSRLALQLVVAAQRLGRAVRRAVGAEGLNLITSAGAAAEQTVFHLHLHVLPRWNGDSLELWPDVNPRRSPEELQAAAARIRRELAADAC